MDLLLILTYTAICIAIFKIFKIPLNKWTVPTAALGGVVLISTLVLLMNYNHPFSQFAGQYYVTTPIISNVRGKVIEIDAAANTSLKQGDVLYKIDPTPFQAEVTQKQAALEQAKQNVLQLESIYKSAQAQTIKAQAEVDRIDKEYKRYLAGYKKGAFTAQQVDTRKQNLLASQAQLESAQANQEQARIGYESKIDGVNIQIAAAQAQLDKAEFNLEQTIVTAPTDGYVTQVMLRPGMMSLPVPLLPAMTFVHKEDEYYIAAFRQNSLLRLKAGYEAEFLFNAIPGRVFKGEVVEVMPSIAEGQVQISRGLVSGAALANTGRTLVKLKINDDMSPYNLPDGANAEVAVYSDHFHHVAVMRKVLIRMKSWQNYLFLDH